MKGLLLKDLYVTKKYCRSLALFVAVFSVMQVINRDSALFAFLPAVIGGMLPMTLIAYDEQARWDEFAGILPVSVAERVIEKYLIGLMGFLAAAAVTLTVHLCCRGTEDVGGFVGVLATVGLLPAAVLLPLVFRFGVNKGRIFYCLLLGGISAFIGVKSGTGDGITGGSWVMVPVVLAVYALSCALSVYLFPRRIK